MGLDTISPDGVHQMKKNESVTIIDVNSRRSWIKARIPGALHLAPTDYDASELPDDKEASLVFYCSNYFCREAPKAARRAVNMGYSNVQVMSAGISGWLRANLPTDSGE